MSKGEKEAKHADLNKVEKEDKNNSEDQIREGQDDSSVWGDENPPAENKYPRKDLQRHQEEDQPEFTEPYSDESKDIDNDKGLKENGKSGKGKNK